jgi:hypothetical protein
MSISKKIRKNVVVKEAPLSFLDSTLYILFIIVFLFICFAPMIIFGLILPEQYAYSSEAVIAFDNSNQWELLFVFPFCISLILTIAMLLAHIGIRPFFGNPHYKPKPRESIIHKDPLFSKAFWRNLSQDTIDDIKKTAIGGLIALLLTAPLLQLCIYPRVVIEDNDRLITYNVFNKVSHSAHVNEAEQLKINIYKTSHKNSTIYDYGIEITVLFEEKSYSFKLGDFKKMNTEETLRYLLHLKSFFSKETYEIEHIERMDKLLDDNDFSDIEIQLVYELLDYKSLT